jgi:hypothetical protein
MAHDAWEGEPISSPPGSVVPGSGGTTGLCVTRERGAVTTGRLATARLRSLAATVAVSGMRPYDLRHAFCSLLIGEGMSGVEVARSAVTWRRGVHEASMVDVA